VGWGGQQLETGQFHRGGQEFLGGAAELHAARQTAQTVQTQRSRRRDGKAEAEKSQARPSAAGRSRTPAALAEALGTLNKAVEAYNRRAYPEAEASYTKAKAQYGQAQAQAEAVQGFHAAEKSYQPLLKISADAALLEKHGGSEWSKVKDLAEQGKAAGEPSRRKQPSHYAAAGASLARGHAGGQDTRAAGKAAEALAAAKMAVAKKDSEDGAGAGGRVLEMEADNKEALALSKQLGPSAASKTSLGEQSGA